MQKTRIRKTLAEHPKTVNLIFTGLLLTQIAVGTAIAQGGSNSVSGP